MVTNSLCIYHGRKEKEKEERRKENIPEDNDRGLQGYSGDYELSKLSSGSRAWKTNDARGKSRFSISPMVYTDFCTSEAGLFACRSTDPYSYRNMLRNSKLRLLNFNQIRNETKLLQIRIKSYIFRTAIYFSHRFSQHPTYSHLNNDNLLYIVARIVGLRDTRSKPKNEWNGRREY